MQVTRINNITPGQLFKTHFHGAGALKMMIAIDNDTVWYVYLGTTVTETPCKIFCHPILDFESEELVVF